MEKVTKLEHEMEKIVIEVEFYSNWGARVTAFAIHQAVLNGLCPALLNETKVESAMRIEHDPKGRLVKIQIGQASVIKSVAGL